MELFSKATPVTAALLLLLVFVLRPVRLQDIMETTADPGPRKTISQEWLRQKLLPNLPAEPQENSLPSSDEQESGVESGMDSSGAVASGSVLFKMEDETNDTAESTTQPSIYSNQTTLAPENPDSSVSTTTQWPSDDGDLTDVEARINQTVFQGEEEVLLNSTNVSTTPQSTTNAPETSTTDAGEVGSGGGVIIETEMTPTTTAAPETTTREESDEPTTTAEREESDEPTTTAEREESDEPTTTAEREESDEPTTTAEREESDEQTTSTEAPETTAPPETTTAAPVTPDLGNMSDKGASAEAESPERGFSSETSDSEKRRRKGAWGAVLGTFVAIAVVALVAYIILKKKHHKAFSHRKLEEDFPSDPVLRLDNSEPLDLNFGRAAYYNPGLQTDNIQMSPFPKN